MVDYKYFENLSLAESKQLVDQLFVEIKERDQVEDILLYLALFTNGECLKDIYPTLIEKKYFDTPEIYKHADSAIADQLIQLVESNGGNTNYLLMCLAWIGTQNVIDFFNVSTERKPRWAKKLYVLPKEYSNQAGWDIMADGTRRMLISQDVKALKNRSELTPSNSDIPTFMPQEKDCPFCASKLTMVFAIPIDDSIIEFTTCLLCSCYEPVFMRIDKDGKCLWHEKNTKWEHFDGSLEMDPIAENTLILSDEYRKPEYTISPYTEISKSQIGGYPTWIQDAEYLNCPDCGDKMDFIGQIDMEDVEEYGEGLYYFQYCRKCRITGVNYQQT